MRPFTRRLVAEYAGSLLLATVVIGSGIAAQRLSPGDVGLQLLENAAAMPPACTRSTSCSHPSAARTSTPWCPWWTRYSAACPGATCWPMCPFRWSDVSPARCWPT